MVFDKILVYKGIFKYFNSNYDNSTTTTKTRIKIPYYEIFNTRFLALTLVFLIIE